jgi:hypothetical protein
MRASGEAPSAFKAASLFPTTQHSFFLTASHFLLVALSRTTTMAHNGGSELPDELHRGRGVYSLGERDPRSANVAPAPRVARVGGGLRHPANTRGRRA